MFLSLNSCLIPLGPYPEPSPCLLLEALNPTHSLCHVRKQDSPFLTCILSHSCLSEEWFYIQTLKRNALIPWIKNETKWGKYSENLSSVGKKHLLFSTDFLNIFYAPQASVCWTQLQAVYISKVPANKRGLSPVLHAYSHFTTQQWNVFSRLLCPCSLS